MKINLQKLALDILLSAIVIIILISCCILILNQFSPFKECETKDDNYVIQLGKNYFTCGELKAINTTIAIT